jgi:predicted protein tyrosine phosphatase
MSGDLIEWADIVFAMERTHRNKIAKQFKALMKGKRLVVLDIPDEYDYMDENLVNLLKARVSRYVQF